MTTKNFVVKNGAEAGNITLNALTDLISTPGNVSAGNILAGGIVSATGNLTAGNISTAGNVSANNLNVSNISASGNISATGNVSFTGANFYLANIANVRIPGGTANYVITTDGSGNISWQPTGRGDANVAGNTTEIQFNDAGNLGASANLTFNKTTNTFSTYSVNVLGNLNFTGPNAYFSNVANIKIPGGTANYVLTTDGTGNLRWEVTGSGNGNGNANVAGTNTQVQFNDDNVLGASANFTFNKTTNALSATYFVGDGSNLTNIAGSNVTGTVANATHACTANVVTDGTQSNITAVGTLTSLSSTGNIAGANLLTAGILSANGNVTGNYILGNGYYLTGVITSSTSISNGNSNVIVEANSNVTVSIAGNANVLVFTGTGANVNGYLYVTGNLDSANANLGNLAIANYFSGNAANLFGIPGANVTGTVANANYAAYAGDVVNATQSNITSVGTLTSLSVSGSANTGNINTGNISASGNLTSANANLGNLATANYFAGNAANLFGIPGANVTGTVANATHASTANTVVNAAQSNITSVGTLTNLSISGNANVGNNVTVSGNAVITGNLVVGGNTVYVNVETLRIEDPIIELGGGPNGDPLTTDDGKDRGSLLHYYSGAPIDAFMGWDSSNSEFALGSNVSVTNEVVTFNTLGNLRIQSLAANIGNFSGNVTAANANLGNVASANFFIGSGNNLGNIQGSNVTGQVGNAAIAGSVYTNSQPNITSVGTLTSLSVSGTVTSGNAVLGNTANANYFYGNGYYLTDLNPGNIGTVANANFAAFAGNITTASQPNITSVGTLASLSSTGNANVANVNTGNISASGNVTVANANLGNAATANFFIGSGNNLSNIQAANITGTVANANYAAYAGDVVNASQSNITSLGILTSLSISGALNGNVVSIIGNLTAANANLGNAARANFFIGSGNNLSNIQGSNVSGTVANANFAAFAGVVTTNAQPNITSLGTLTGLTVGPNSSVILSGTSGYVKANSIQGNDGSQTIYLYYGNISGAAGVATDLTVGASGTGNLLVSGTGNVTGNLRAANANLGNAVSANFFIGSGNNLSNIQVGNVSGLGNIATINLDGSASNVLYGNGIFAPAASPYGNSNVASFLASYGSNTITTTGNVSFGNIAGTGLTANGNVSLTGANVYISNVANLKIPGGSANYVLTTDGASNLSWSSGAAGSDIVTDAFTGDGSNVAFTLSVTPANENATTVNYNGASVLRSDYSLAGNVITFDSAPATGSKIEITTIKTVSFAGLGNVSTLNLDGNANNVLYGNGSFAAPSITTGKSIAMAMIFGF